MSRRLLLLALLTATVGVGTAALLLWPSPPPARSVPRPHREVRAGPDNRGELAVTETGFEPSPVHVAAGRPVTLVVTRKTDQTCATELVVPGTDAGTVPLPLNTPVTVTFTPPRSGALRYGCTMGMMVSGILLVD